MLMILSDGCSEDEDDEDGICETDRTGPDR